MRKLILTVSGMVILVLMSGYWFEVVCTIVALLVLWLPVRLAGFVGQAIGAGLDAEIERRRRQDELVRLLLQVAQRGRGR